MKFYSQFHPSKIAPVGGQWYEYEDDKKNVYRVNGYDISWERFLDKIREHMIMNHITVPDNLEYLVEDQICMRQPKSRCYYENKAGDQIANVIHQFARSADTVAAKLGFQTQLEKKAKGCRRCGQRRQRLNNL